MNTEFLLLTWLHNVYLRPGRILLRLSTSKYMKALFEEGLIEETKFFGAYPVMHCTSKGKKFLMKNIHILTPEE